MKMAPASYNRLKDRKGTAVLVKRRPSGKVAHLAAPLKGLSRFAEVGETDPQYASILTNWIVEEDRITIRPGFIKIGEITGNPPIRTLVPYYGEPQRLAAAAGGGLYALDGAELDSGYDNPDWAWASFSNLSDADYTIMVNGADGVVSWDGVTFATEAVTAPAGETWIDPSKFDKVLSHMNYLWFADSENLALYYLPLQQKSGEVEFMPFNAIFKHGGHIVAIHNWTVDGGAGLDDAIVIFTSNGEAAIYSGVDPGSDFKLIGVFHFDAPMSKSSVMNFGGDLYVLISTGLVPMTALIRNETEGLGKADKGVTRYFSDVSRVYRDSPGWQLLLNHQTNHFICNMPVGDGKYHQMVRMMTGPIWSKWEDVPSSCWGWLEEHAYFGSEDGNIYLGGTEYLNDDGKAIHGDVRFAWSNYKSAAKKQFKMVRLYTITDGVPRPFVDMEVDYSNLTAINQPDDTVGGGEGTPWDTATWDVDFWALGPVPKSGWQGVSGLGRVGAPHIRVNVTSCAFSITGIDVLYEDGGLL